jgi:hypothetical protein
MSDLLRRFEEQNKGIKVVLDQVPCPTSAPLRQIGYH